MISALTCIRLLVPPLLDIGCLMGSSTETGSCGDIRLWDPPWERIKRVYRRRGGHQSSSSSKASGGDDVSVKRQVRQRVATANMETTIIEEHREDKRRRYWLSNHRFPSRTSFSFDTSWLSKKFVSLSYLSQSTTLSDNSLNSLHTVFFRVSSDSDDSEHVSRRSTLDVSPSRGAPPVRHSSHTCPEEVPT